MVGNVALQPGRIVAGPPTRRNPYVGASDFPAIVGSPSERLTLLPSAERGSFFPCRDESGTMTDSDSSSRGGALRYVMGLLYVATGVGHFLAPKALERIVPPQLPEPMVLVYVSGVAEIALGIGVMFERTRRASAWGIIALLLAVFPANVYMAVDGMATEMVPDRFDDAAQIAAWLRLPLQAVLIGWAWLYTRPSETDE